MDARVRWGRGPRIGFAAAVIFVSLGAALLRIPDLDDNPNGFFCDEASVGFDAVSLLETGRDQYGTFLPAYARSFGDYDEASYRYLTIPFVASLGRTVAAVRLPAAIAGILTVVLVMLFARAAFGDRAGILCGLFLAVSPWHVQFSRIGFRAVLLPLAFVAMLYFLVRTPRRRIDIALAGLCGALALWTYSPARIVVPMFAMLLALAYGRELWRASRRATIAAAAIFALVLIACASFWISPEGMARAQSTMRPASFVTNYLTYFSPSFLFMEGDPNLRHSIRGWGEVLPIEILTIPFGIFAALSRRTRPHLLVLGWLLLAPIPAALTEPYQALRAILMAPAYAVLSGIGAAALIESFRRPFARTVLIGASAVLLCLFGLSFSRDYARDYPRDSLTSWQWGLREAIATLDATDRPCHVVSSRIFLPHIFVLYFGGVAPREYQARPITTISQSRTSYERYDIGRWRIRVIPSAVRDSRECSFVALTPEMAAVTPLPGFERIRDLVAKDGRPYFTVFQFRRE